MKERIALFLIVLAFSFVSSVLAQNMSTREDSIADLKQQLIGIESKETQLRIGLEELDEELKPENIERALAGIGSTRPEELRDHRRRLLTIERNGLKAQLDLLQDDRTRVESAIAAAESAAYLKYAQPSPTPTPAD
jgi:hypothetical protein